MPANPIQKRTRNSFLMGMLIMLLVAVAVIAVLYFVIFADAIDNAKTKKQDGTVIVYRLTTDIKSGETLQNNKLEPAEYYVDDLPNDYIKAPFDIESYKSKIDLGAGTVISASLLYQNEEVAHSTRLMEYNMLTLPSTIRPGNYIDVRFMMPSGEDYIVLSKKQVVSLNNTTVGLLLTEDEILMMSSAIIESYIMKASNLYAVQYVEAGMQNAAIATYSVNPEVYQLIQANSQKGVNIEDYSKINDSYNANLRATIEQELSQYQGSELVNVETGLQTQKENAMSLYLSGLSGN